MNGEMLTRDELFAARLYAATYYVKHGRGPTAPNVAFIRGITLEQAKGAIASIDYRPLAAMTGRAA